MTDNTTNGPGKSVLLWLYADDRVTSYSYALPNTNTYFAGGNHFYNPTPGADPPWFTW